MNRQQLKVANQLEQEREAVCDELKRWEDFTSFSKMAYVQSSHGRFELLHSNVPPSVFANFRHAAIEHLRERLKEVDAEFKNL